MRSSLWRACSAISHWDLGLLSSKALGIRGLSTDEAVRDVMQYDVCIVGAGPAGLAAAIRTKQVSRSLGVLDLCAIPGMLVRLCQFPNPSMFTIT